METRPTASPTLPALKERESKAQRTTEPLRRLILILALFAGLGVLYIWQVPPFEGPDEAQHFAYIRWLVEQGTFPPQGAAAWDTPVQQEGGQPPLYYLLASLPARLVDLEDPEAVYRPNPYAFTAPPPRTLADNDNRAIHIPGEMERLAGGWLALYAARALTLVAGALTLVAVYGLARETAPPRPEMALLATLLVAVTPQFVYISSVASNDVPAAALGTVTLWLLAKTVRRGTNRTRALLLGAAYGAAAITKVSTLALGVPIAAGLLWLWLSDRHALREVAQAGLWLALSASAVGGWWFVRSWLLYGAPLGLEAHDMAPWAIRDPESVFRPLARWQEVFRTFWIALGWGTIRPDQWVYQALALVTGLAVAGLVWAVWRRRSRKGDLLAGRSTGQRTTAFLCFLLGLTLLTMTVSLDLWMRRVVAPHGRLLFPAIGAVAIFLTAGWRALHPRFPAAAIGFIALLALIAPPLLLQPAYSRPEMMAVEEAAAMETPLRLHFAVQGKEPAIELVSAAALERSVRAGSNLPVRVCWQAIGQPAGDYTVLVHVLGPDDALVASRRTYPGLGRYPTSIWRPGDAFCDVVRVAVRDDLAKTLVYRVEVALLDEEAERRLQIFDADGNEWPILIVDNARLVSAEEERASSLPGDEALHLLGYEAVEQWRAGEKHSLALKWGVARPVAEDYQIFVHLRDQETGEIVAQADGPPLDGWYPTSWWTAGEVIVDERSFALPDSVPAGRYQLVTGFYELESGQRFGSEYHLATVEVTS